MGDASQLLCSSAPLLLILKTDYKSGQTRKPLSITSSGSLLQFIAFNPLWFRKQISQDDIEHGCQLGHGCADYRHYHSVTEMKAADLEAK